MRFHLLVPIACGLALGLPAQDRHEPPVFKLELNIKDGTEAAAKTGRRYMLLMNNGEKGIFRSGNRMPIASANGSVNYVDVGVNIDATAQERNGTYPIRAEIEISTASKAETSPQPVIGQMRITVNTTVNLGKSTPVASVDDPVTQRKFEVDALLTKVN